MVTRIVLGVQRWTMRATICRLKGERTPGAAKLFDFSVILDRVMMNSYDETITTCRLLKSDKQRAQAAAAQADGARAAGEGGAVFVHYKSATFGGACCRFRAWARVQFLVPFSND
jgi:hypothetical protein